MHYPNLSFLNVPRDAYNSKGREEENKPPRLHLYVLNTKKKFNDMTDTPSTKE